MIPVPDCMPPLGIQAALAAWQAEVDQHAQPFGDHVAAAEREFDRRRAQRGFEPDVVWELLHRKGTPRQQPPKGDAVLLNPRVDDPQAYLALDLLGTFRFVPSATPGSVPHLRAAHTLDKLDLNDDALQRVRRNAYENFLSHLRIAGQACATGDGAEVARVRGAIVEMPCAVVWREMQRMHAVIPTLGRAFAAVPGAVHW